MILNLKNTYTCRCRKLPKNFLRKTWVKIIHMVTCITRTAEFHKQSPIFWRREKKGSIKKLIYLLCICIILLIKIFNMYLTEVNIQIFVYMNEIFRQAIFLKNKILVYVLCQLSSLTSYRLTLWHARFRDFLIQSSDLNWEK